MITESDRRCPYDSKRMMLEVIQDDDTGSSKAIHECWTCNYFELDIAWPPRRRPPVVLAEIGQADATT